MLIRQGDVLIVPINEIPKGDRKARRDGALAYGEVTGHSHRVAELTKAQVFDIDGQGAFLSVSEEGVSIVHEEHQPVFVPAGDHKIRIQKEYGPESVRNVAD